MRKLVMFILTVTVSVFSIEVHGQDQGVQWKKFIGDKEDDDFLKIVPAADGGYLMIGSQNIPDDGNYRTDLWLVKVNNVGAFEWQKTYGGSNREWGQSGIATADGGFMIVGGTCTVENDGDVTGHHGLDPTVFVDYEDEHPQDIWVLKINAEGILLWEKAFGGSRWDEGHAIIKTNDGNYMIAGKTSSWDGDLNGHRRSTVGATGTDNSDLWVFKIDDTGNLLWQQCYGGNSDDNANCIIAKTNGYIIGGWTESNDQDVIGYHGNGYTDAWLIDINTDGTINWSKVYGGSQSDYVNALIPYNLGYLIGGSTSSFDGDVIGFHKTSSGNLVADIWLMEVNTNGNLTWQLPIGTTDDESLYDMIALPGNMVTLVGYTGPFYNHVYSPLIIKLDNNKNIVYQQVLNNFQGTSFRSITSSDGYNYYIGGGVGIRNYKFPAGHISGNSDGLLVKFGDVNTITGKVFVDNNSNNIYDTGDKLIDNVKVISGKNGSVGYGSITNNGVYKNSVDTGSYVTSAYIDNPNYSVNPVTENSSFSTYFNSDTIDFVLSLIPGRNDLKSVLYPLRPARPGFETKYQIKVFNKGTTTQNAVVKLVKDPRLSVVLSEPAAESIVNDTLTWQIASFEPFNDSTFTITMQVPSPTAVNIGDTLKLRVAAYPVTGDIMPDDNADTLKHLVIGSYDPNDKTETHGGIISPEQISGADPLTYLIRFQNTGTDTAFNVTVRDTLESRLDWNSLQMISASHSYQLSIEDGNKLTWQFDNIKLPDNSINEPASHGYIAYRIKPLPTVAVGDTIKNTAGIYFDYNLPVATNTSNTIVFRLLSPLPVTLLSFNAALAGSIVNVTWKTSIEQNASHFEVLRSANGVDFTTIGMVQAGNTTYLFQDKQPLKGYNYYRLKAVDKDESYKYSTIVLVNVKDGADIISSLYPNPGNGNVTLKLQGTVQGNVLVQVLDQQGRMITAKQLGVQNAAEFKAPLDLGKLSKGNYILKIVVGDKIYLHKLLIQ